MPSTLPPSTTGITGGESDPSSKPRYVVSQSGHAAHPDDIIASCRALQAHVSKLQADADAELRALDERFKARVLAEKRRVAPGWLDSDARLLEPERKPGAGAAGTGGGEGGFMLGEVASGDERSMSEQFRGMSIASGSGQGQGPEMGVSEMAATEMGAELDRAFGS